MKLIKQTKLFFKEGTSDKVYEIDLCEVGTNGHCVVNFRYGKRGAALKEGTKTTAPVERARAEEIFDALAAEKRKGGYQSETEMFQVLPVLTNTAPNTVEGTLLQRLQNAIDNHNTFKTVWSTSRVAWRVGELKFAEAVPYLIKLVEKGDAMQRYCILWALARCADTRAIPTFQAYNNQSKVPANVRKIANEGLLKTLSGDDRIKLVDSLLDKLPKEMKQYVLAKNRVALQNCITERLQEKQTEYNFLENLYALAQDYSFIHKIIVDLLTHIAFKPPYFKHIRSIYKTAEFRDDALVLGVLAYRFEKTPKMFDGVPTSSEADEDSDYGDWYYKKYFPEFRQEIHIKKELKKKDSRLAFSDLTKDYFQKRMVEYLKEIGKTDGITYVKLATAMLLQYKKEDVTPPTTKPQGTPRWDNKTKQYEHRIIDLPACAKSLCFNQILLGNHPNFVFNKKTLEWQSKTVRTVYNNNWYYSPNDVSFTPQPTSASVTSALGSITNWLQQIFTPKKAENEVTTSPENVTPVRPELYPEHWDKLPQAYIQLLIQANLEIVQEFAYHNLTQHSEYEMLTAKLDDETVIKLVSSTYQIPALFGLKLAKIRLAEKMNKNLVLFLLASPLLAARMVAQEIIGKQVQDFVQETQFIVSLIFNQYADVQVWAKTLLAKIELSEETKKVLVGKSVVEMLAVTENSAANNEKLANVIAILVQIAPKYVENIAWKIIEELLVSPVAQNNVLASEILVLKLQYISADAIPFAVLNKFLDSEIEELRKNGMAIFAQYPEAKLFDATDLLSQMLVARYDNIRKPTFDLCKKLVEKSQDFAQTISPLLLATLIKKEKFEGSHQEIADFILQTLANSLGSINLKTTLSLIYCNYRQGQMVGFHILKNHSKHEELTIRQVVALGNHELLALRHWCLDFYAKNLSRIRYERDEALRLLDAKWDDMRVAAIDFFRHHFREQDWDLDSLVSVADSVRPDIEAFGKEMITKYFHEEDGQMYLAKLSQHPSVNMQLFASNYLDSFAADDLEKLKSLEFYFRSVLTRVNKARVVKDRVLLFLEKEALKSEPTAQWVATIFNDLIVTNAIQDKARCIEILQQIKTKFEKVKVAVNFESLAV